LQQAHQAGAGGVVAARDDEFHRRDEQLQAAARLERKAAQADAFGDSLLEEAGDGRLGGRLDAEGAEKGLGLAFPFVGGGGGRGSGDGRLDGSIGGLRRDVGGEQSGERGGEEGGAELSSKSVGTTARGVTPRWNG